MRLGNNYLKRMQRKWQKRGDYMNKIEMFFLVLATCIMGVAMGIVVHVYENSRSENALLKDAKILNSLEQNEESLSTATNVEKTSPNAKIIFETYYEKCGHTIVSTQGIDKEDVNKTEKEIRDKYSQYEVKEFSSNKIVLCKRVDKICDNHYVVKQKDGVIAVFSKNDDGTETLKSKTDVSTKYLPKEDVDLLENGIEANSNEELEQILSDYE